MNARPNNPISAFTTWLGKHTGTALVYSTYLGGSGSDFGKSIAVDSSGKVYLAGQTDSADFPTTNAFQSSLSGGFGVQDAFFTVLGAAGTNLIYSTYLGGPGFESANGVAVDLLSVGAGEPFLELALAAPAGSMIDVAPLVYLKLKSTRRKDQVDVIEMIKGGIDAKRCGEYLAAHAPAFVGAFEECVALAESEED